MSFQIVPSKDNFFVSVDKSLVHRAIKRVVEANGCLVTPRYHYESKEDVQRRMKKTILEVYGSWEAYEKHCKEIRERQTRR